jgi:MFS family permease
MPRGPLAGRYPAVAAMVIFSLIPYLGLASAIQPVTPIIGKQLHMSLQELSLTSGMANAAYAVGTVLAVLFAQHLPQRRMMLIYGALLLLGSVLAAGAQDPAMFIVGHILQGLCTSLLLIAAAPPLAVGFPPSKLPWTAAIMNMGIFGAVSVGPLVGGAQAAAHGFRALFWIVAGIAAVAFVLMVLTFEDAPPADETAPKDLPAIALAAAGCASAFFGASELATHSFLSAVALGPLLAGLVLVVILVTYQFRGHNTLLTINQLASTVPIAGILTAICAAAASGTAIALVGAVVPQRFSPMHAGLLFLPMLGGALLSAFLFGRLITTRMVHHMVLVAMILTGAGILVLGRVVPPNSVVLLAGSGMLGIGIGGSVAPALFLAGLSLPPLNLQRVFAIIELLRAIAAFMVAPVISHYAATASGGLDHGTGTALWICFGIAAAGTIVGVALYWLGGIGLRALEPSLDRWSDGQAGAWDSPPLLARVRGRRVLERV